jgi:hypothetical protein
MCLSSATRVSPGRVSEQVRSRIEAFMDIVRQRRERKR